MNELTNCEIDFVRGDGELVVSRVGWGLDLPLKNPIALTSQVAG